VIEMFLGLILVCDPNEPTSCAVVRGAFFDTYDECLVDLATAGLTHVVSQYGPDVHLGYLDCVPVELQGEPL